MSAGLNDCLLQSAVSQEELKSSDHWKILRVKKMQSLVNARGKNQMLNAGKLWYVDTTKKNVLLLIIYRLINGVGIWVFHIKKDKYGF